MYVMAPTCIPCKISTQEWEARESEFKVIASMKLDWGAWDPVFRQTKKTKKTVPVAVVSLLSFEKDD